MAKISNTLDTIRHQGDLPQHEPITNEDQLLNPEPENAPAESALNKIMADQPSELFHNTEEGSGTFLNNNVDTDISYRKIEHFSENAK